MTHIKGIQIGNSPYRGGDGPGEGIAVHVQAKQSGQDPEVLRQGARERVHRQGEGDNGRPVRNNVSNRS